MVSVWTSMKICRLVKSYQSPCLILHLVSDTSSDWHNKHGKTNQKFNPLPDDKSLDCSKLRQIADDILKCIQNGK